MNGLVVRHNRPDIEAAGIEVVLVADDPANAFERSVAAGAISVAGLEAKPWGQIVGYVRDINGCLVEICSPMTGSSDD